MIDKKLNITFIDLDDKRNPLLAAGQAWATYEVGRRLVNRGHKVSVICSRYPGSQDRFENGIHYKHIGIGSSNIKINNALFFLAAPLAVKNTKSDIIIECSTAPISTLFSPLFTKIPVIILPSMFNAMEFSKKYHLPFHVFEKYGVRLYRYAMPYSDIDSKKITSMNPQIHCKIVSQGVGEEYLSIKPKKSEFILFLGRFDIAQKGIDLLIESYSKVADEIKYPLIIAGHGPDRNAIKQLITRKKLSKKIKLIGSLYGKEKLNMMSKAVCVPFPSRHDELSLWSLEALAGGLPLVTFDLPEAKWLPTSASLKAKKFDTNHYAKLLLKATDPKINRQMRKKAREVARAFSWKKVASDFENFMFDILRRENKQ